MLVKVRQTHIIYQIFLLCLEGKLIGLFLKERESVRTFQTYPYKYRWYLGKIQYQWNMTLLHKTECKLVCVDHSSTTVFSEKFSIFRVQY